MCVMVKLLNPKSMCAEDIITAYAHRFKIAAMFREMKQCFGGFCCRFWSKAVPKIDRYRRKTASGPLELVKDEQERTKILKTLRAVEGCVLFSSTAMGNTQMLCLKLVEQTFNCSVNEKIKGFLISGIDKGDLRSDLKIMPTIVCRFRLGNPLP